MAYLEEERALGRLKPESHVEAVASMLVGYCHDAVLGTIFPHTNRLAPPPPESVVKTALNGIAP